jgi:hypothetical protein
LGNLDTVYAFGAIARKGEIAELQIAFRGAGAGAGIAEGAIQDGLGIARGKQREEGSGQEQARTRQGVLETHDSRSCVSVALPEKCSKAGLFFGTVRKTKPAGTVS